MNYQSHYEKNTSNHIRFAQWYSYDNYYSWASAIADIPFLRIVAVKPRVHGALRDW